MSTKEKTADPAAYAKYREKQAAISAERSRAGRDIGPLPAVVNPDRRVECGESFEKFCRIYFPEVFYLGWSADHRKAIDRIEKAVRVGGLFAYAMPRGSGKTALAIRACLWALLYGYREFVVFVGADLDSSVSRLSAIKIAIETNDLLLEDFPEVCYPIRRLEGIVNRQGGQTLDGLPTNVRWTDDEIILPTVKGSKASGGAIRAAGITGSIRGMMLARRSDGRNIRPDLVVCDDPQTEESARSPSQCRNRVKTLNGAVLGLAGPGKKISGFMPCTVIERGDMADIILDRNEYPAWRGERWQFVYKWPENYETLWATQYAKIRADGQRSGDDNKACNDFYAANREAMDAGAEVAWPARHEPDELSGIQHAINLRLDRKDEIFFAEYQNAPLAPSIEADVLTAEQIAEKINNRDRGTVPVEVGKLTAFIDVQKAALFWVVCGWAEDFTGYVVDYGIFPKQNRNYIALREIKQTLQAAMKTKSLEAAIYGGLQVLTADLCGRKWRRDDGTELTIERCLIDANWGESTDVIYKFCRESAHAAVITPSHGIGVGATSRPFDEYRRKRGDRIGDHWRMPVSGGRVVRKVVYDTNHWKSFRQARLAVPIGGPGCLSLFGNDSQQHKLFADHQVAETPVIVTAKGRTVTEWKIKNTRPDNHLGDCLAGCFVAASMQGVSLEERKAAAAAPVKRVKRFSEMERSKHR